MYVVYCIYSVRINNIFSGHFTVVIHRQRKNIPCGKIVGKLWENCGKIAGNNHKNV